MRTERDAVIAFDRGSNVIVSITLPDWNKALPEPEEFAARYGKAGGDVVGLRATLTFEVPG